jgi:hypothetical protein
VVAEGLEDVGQLLVKALVEVMHSVERILKTLYLCFQVVYLLLDVRGGWRETERER